MQNSKSADQIAKLQVYLTKHKASLQSDTGAQQLAADMLEQLSSRSYTCKSDYEQLMNSEVCDLVRRMNRNADKLAEINAACEKAFSKWRDDAISREMSRHRLTNQLHVKVKTCIEKSTLKSSRTFLHRPGRPAREYRKRIANHLFD